MSVGEVKVICGCMFSGKSESLIRELRRCEIARLRVAAFKPTVDDRYGTGIVSHGGIRFRAISVEGVGPMLDAVGLADVVGIDEAQFFDDHLVDAVLALSAAGKRVIVAGLDLDFRGRPFGPVPALLALADHVTKVHAICTTCGSDASRSQRIVDSQEQVLVGAASAYEARCRAHWSPEPVFARQEAAGELDG